LLEFTNTMNNVYALVQVIFYEFFQKSI